MLQAVLSFDACSSGKSETHAIEVGWLALEPLLYLCGSLSCVLPVLMT